MEKNNKRTGIWIPQILIDNNKLDWMNKILLSEIYSLNSLEKGCFGSNKHFGDLLGITDNAASRRITKLKEKKFINTQNVYDKGRCIGRKIVPLKQETITDKTRTNEVDDQSKGSTHGNDTIVPEDKKCSSQTTRSIVPEQQESGSQMTSGVLPEQHESTSDGNTNNALNNTPINNTENSTTRIIHGSKQDIEEIIKHSSFLNKLFFNNPDALEQFKKAYEEYSNENKNSMSQVHDDMNYIFHDYSNWEEDLKNLGYDQFMHTINQYHDGTPYVVAGIVASLIRILQHRTQ